MLAAIFNLVFRKGNVIYFALRKQRGPKCFVNID